MIELARMVKYQISCGLKASLWWIERSNFIADRGLGTNAGCIMCDGVQPVVLASEAVVLASTMRYS